MPSEAPPPLTHPPIQQVLLTGAGGFIGSWVCQELARRNTPVVAAGRSLDRLNAVSQQITAAQPCTIDVCRIDFAQPDDIQRAAGEFPTTTHVIHLACPVPKSTTNPKTNSAKLLIEAENTLIGFLQLAERLPRLRHIVFLSSASVYGATYAMPGKPPITENSPCDKDLDAYGLHKHLAEQRLAWWAAERGVSLATLRLCQTYGGGEPHGRALSSMIRAALAGKPILLHNGGEDRRDLLYVADAAKAIVLAAQRSISGVFNLSTGAGATMRRFAEAIRRATPFPVEIQRLPVTREATSLVYDNTRLKQAIGMERLTPLDQAIKQCVDYQRSRNSIDSRISISSMHFVREEAA